MRIVSSPSLTFKQCLELGVDKHEDELKRISDNASEEYVIELAMDKMMKEWNDVKLQFESYKNDTDTYVMNLSDEGLRMLDDHILLTERLSLSSFKGIFEEQLVQWDADLRLAKEVIETWIEFQKYVFKNCTEKYYINITCYTKYLHGRQFLKTFDCCS